jgi:hypothetical protein
MGHSADSVAALGCVIERGHAAFQFPLDQLLALAADPSASLARVTLVAMEIVLGVDNLARH